MSKVYPITKERYQNKYWQKVTDYRFVSKSSTAQLVGAELSRAVLNFPIAIIKYEENYIPAALLSIIPGTNLFVNANGKWAGGYIPASIRAYPFKLLYSKDNQVIVCFDENSNLITEDPKDVPFYDAEGNLSEEVQSVVNLLTEYEKNRSVTVNACNFLAENKLLEPWNINLKFGEKEKKFEGLFKINEKAINSVDDTKFLEIKNKGTLQIIYAQLYSMGQLAFLKRLANMRFSKNKMNETDIPAESDEITKDGDVELDWDKVLKNLK